MFKVKVLSLSTKYILHSVATNEAVVDITSSHGNTADSLPFLYPRYRPPWYYHEIVPVPAVITTELPHSPLPTLPFSNSHHTDMYLG